MTFLQLNSLHDGELVVFHCYLNLSFHSPCVMITLPSVSHLVLTLDVFSLFGLVVEAPGIVFKLLFSMVHSHKV